MKKHSLSDVGGRREEDRKLLIKSGQSQLGRSFFFLFSFFNFTRNEISVPAPEEKRERSRSFLSFFSSSPSFKSSARSCVCMYAVYMTLSKYFGTWYFSRFLVSALRCMRTYSTVGVSVGTSDGEGKIPLRVCFPCFHLGSS